MQFRHKSYLICAAFWYFMLIVFLFLSFAFIFMMYPTIYSLCVIPFPQNFYLKKLGFECRPQQNDWSLDYVHWAWFENIFLVNFIDNNRTYITRMCIHSGIIFLRTKYKHFIFSMCYCFFWLMISGYFVISF